MAFNLDYKTIQDSTYLIYFFLFYIYKKNNLKKIFLLHILIVESYYN